MAYCVQCIIITSDVSWSADEAGPEELEYRAEDMCATTFSQLSLRVGASETDYCLCHQGCCEHALVVTDVRRVSACDPPWRAAYPLLVYQVGSPGLLGGPVPECKSLPKWPFVAGSGKPACNSRTLRLCPVVQDPVLTW